MKSKYTHLFEPIRINQMTLKNRVIGLAGVSASTVKMFGAVTAAEQIAKGGAAMIVTTMADVDHPKSNFYPGSTYTMQKSERDKIRSFTQRIHQYGAKYMIELDHVGEYYRAESGDFSLGTEDKVNEKGIHVKKMDLQDMEEIKASFCKSAQDAIDLGFDAILFDCSSGWLMSQFISTFYNHRTDEFGGDIHNRAKFPLSVLKAIRERVGKDFPIMIGFSANEFFEVNSTPLKDFVELSRMAEPYVDGILVGCGNDQTRMQMTKGVSTNLEKFLMCREYTREIKKVVSIPVITTNAILTPEDADEVIASGDADMVGLCRALIADHEWVHKAQRNESEDITPCLRCNMCFHISTDIRHVGCSVNPLYTQTDSYYITPIHKAEEAKHVVVVGAGPAGIRAALAADACGHRVTLIEQEGEIGGLLRKIGTEHFKTEIARYLIYLRTQVSKSKINLVLNQKATKEVVEGYRPDKLIVAIGAEEKRLKVPYGLNVLTALEAISDPSKVGQNVVIIGGGTVGVELAVGYGLEDGKQVTIVEMTDQLAATANLIYRPALLDRVEKRENIHPLVNASVTAVEDGAVTVKGKTEQKLTADTVIVSVGMRPRYDEAYDLFGIVEDTICIGDCDKVGNIIDATFTGYTAGVNA